MTVTEGHKKIAAAVLSVVAVYLVYTTFFSGSGAPEAPATVSKSGPRSSAPLVLDIPQKAAAALSATRPKQPAGGGRKGGRSLQQEWVPTMKRRSDEAPPDPMSMDPTLRLDLLAKLQNVTVQSSERSLFDFSNAPAKPIPDVTIKPGKGAKPSKGKPNVSDLAAAKPGGDNTAAGGKPALTPIPLKFYGFISGREGKRAFFLNGDDIFTAAEGQTIQSRYKVLRIGVNAAVIEDTQQNNKQSIPLEELPNQAGT